MIGGLTNAEVLDLCKTYKLTIKQLWYIYLLYTNDIKTVLAYAGTVLNPNKPNKSKFGFEFDRLTKEELIQLVGGDYIRNLDGSRVITVDEHNIADIDISTPFTSKLWIKLDIAGRELIAEYPDFINIQGKQIPAKVGDHVAIGKKYCSLIKNSKRKHTEIIELLKEYKETNEFATMKLENFVNSEGWNTLKIERTSTKIL